MGALVTVMVSPHLADGCAVAKDAAAALVADGWRPPAEEVFRPAGSLTPIIAPHLVKAAQRREEEEARQAAFEQHTRDICAPAIAWTVAWMKRRPLIHNGRKPTARRRKR